MLYKLQEMEFMFTILFILRFMHGVLGDCTVDSESEDKYTKLLKPLNSKTISNVRGNKTAEWKYTINFCAAVEGSEDAGVMQIDNWGNKTDKDQKHVVGKITDTDIKVGNDWILLTYKEGDEYGTHCGGEARQAHIMLLCNRKLIGNTAIIEENNNKDKDCSYLFEVESSVACTKQSDLSLSFGSIFCIIVLTAIVAYIFFGFLYNRFILGAKGMEQVPNVAFWRDFGNLEADGCDFIFRSKLSEEPRSYKGLGDDQLGLDEDEERDDHLLPMY